MENDRASNAGKARGGCPVLAGVATALTLAEGTALALAAYSTGGTCAAVIAAGGFSAVLLSATSLCKAAAGPDSAA